MTARLLWSTLATLLMPLSSLSCCAVAVSHAAPVDGSYTISGPEAHENLAIFFIHGKSAPGPAPLTLQEALAAGKTKVYETGNVNELAIENKGDQEVFVQAGDIVKGGQQDRVLMVSLVMPAHSGRMPIGAFCVEPGRWTKRGAEDSRSFASAEAVMPSKASKLAMAKSAYAAAPEARPAEVAGAPPEVSVDATQQEVWKDVDRVQRKLSANLGASVTTSTSPTSLKLALENKKLEDAQASYIKALKPAGESSDDIVGYVTSVNGKLASADIYPSNALFRKMWPRLLTASVTDALTEKDATSAAVPTRDAAQAFLDDAAKPKATTTELNKYARQSKREDDKTISIDTLRNDGSWMHRSVIAQ